jgi:hypothetical protein
MRNRTIAVVELADGDIVRRKESGWFARDKGMARLLNEAEARAREDIPASEPNITHAAILAMKDAGIIRKIMRISVDRRPGKPGVIY